MVRKVRSAFTLIPGVLLAAGTLGVSLVAGCGSDGVPPYGDGYTCDGYGCSPNNSSTPGKAPSVPSASPTGTGSPNAVDAGTTAACRYSSECSTEKVCVNGQCLASCGAGTTCASGFRCENEACREVPSAGSCTTKGDCGATELCASGKCVSACTTDATCGAGKYCLGGGCVIDTRPAPNCRADLDCESNGGPARACIEGFCKFRCATGDDCLRIDGRIPVCAADKVCRSTAEENPQCTSKEQCMQGQDCVGNVCK